MATLINKHEIPEVRNKYNMNLIKNLKKCNMITDVLIARNDSCLCKYIICLKKINLTFPFHIRNDQLMTLDFEA